ncbi:MAG: MATE family efflux transporter [Firmicutes bacterium]|nr:MATE family efflux transporter [Bacillota bacterium]MDD7601691.1 MATE family efflux transporter [Bacillota bacterium]
MQNPLGTAPVGALLRKFALPSIVAMLVGALYNIVDQFFIGQSIGELGNAATNVAFPLNTSCTAIALLLGIGAASAFNLTMGRGNREKALYYIGNAATLLFGFGLLLCLVTEIFLRPMLLFFGSPEDVLGYAMEYVRITAIGFPFLILSNGGTHLVRADGSPRYSMLCNLSGAILNTILDPIFIFGLNMGMSGAALATILGQIFAGILVIRYLRGYHSGRLTAKHIRPQRDIAGYAMSLGLAPFLNQIAMMVVQVVMNNSLTWYGARSVYGESIPLACSGIINKVGFLFFSICIGIAQGMQPISSFNYGAEKYGRVRQVLKLSLMSGSVVCILAFCLFQLFPRQIIGFFGDGSDLYFTFAQRYFRIYMFFTFLNNIQPLSSTFFTSIGMPGKGAFLSLTRQILFLLPLIVVLPLFLGIDGIMYAGPVADLLAALIAALMLRRQMGKMKENIAGKKDFDGKD